jgi:hypothetical protein
MLVFPPTHTDTIKASHQTRLDHSTLYLETNTSITQRPSFQQPTLHERFLWNKEMLVANWPTDPVYFFTFESSIPVPSGDSSDIPQACALAPHIFRKHACPLSKR